MPYRLSPEHLVPQIESGGNEKPYHRKQKTKKKKVDLIEQMLSKKKEPPHTFEGLYSFKDFPSITQKDFMKSHWKSVNVTEIALKKRKNSKENKKGLSGLKRPSILPILKKPENSNNSSVLSAHRGSLRRPWDQLVSERREMSSVESIETA